MSRPSPLPPLPIDDVLPALRDALAGAGAAVLRAPPGAGKTTRVPLALMGEPWLAGRRIVMLEPRRLAARAAARHMAALLGEEPGQRVGYRTRHDTRVGPAGRIEVVTEGVLTRILQNDPGLDGTGLLVFDEYHERSVHADLGLALALLSRELLRPDLRILVMSATLDAGPVAGLLGDAPEVTSEGRLWPVEVQWLGTPPPGGLEAATAAAVRRSLERDVGDVLVFLPGRREIHRTAGLLDGAAADVLPLYGELPPAAQDRAIQPGPPGRRRVVLATSIAETSLTIEGVRTVVDAGLARSPRFSPRTGLTRLETVRVSRASADQRAGRAGRVGPGVCRRLWSEAEHAGLVPRQRPEILEADLAPLALELAAAGIGAPGELRWLDEPPAGAFAQARGLLTQLDALDAGGRITPHGRRMAALPLHPRLAHLLLRADALDATIPGAAALGAALAALLEERDPLGDGPPDADLRHRVELVLGVRLPPGLHRSAVRGDVVQRVRDTARRLRRSIGAGAVSRRKDEGADSRFAGLLLSFAYPDRLARRRPGGEGRFLLRSGRGVSIDPSDPLAQEPWIVAADVADAGLEGRVYRAAPVDLEDLLAHHAGLVEREEELGWDTERDAVRARTLERIGAIVIRDLPLPNPDRELIQRALLAELRRRGVGALPWSDAARSFRQRVAFLRTIDPAAWPDLSDDALEASLEEWLGPLIGGVRTMDALRALDLAGMLRARLGWQAAAVLDEQAPTHLTVPTGSRVPVDYSDPTAPVLAVRLQEMFGTAETPRLAGGRVPVTLHLLSPAHRPVQVTRDLGGFWSGSYAEVRKELRGRYPRHEWPEDPLAAAPTRRAKPRRST